MKTNIQDLIKLAGKNLQDSPTATADALLDGLRAIESEHAALVAVAEAAHELLDLCKCNHTFAQRGACKQTEIALANLAAVREGGAK